jgi:hypothetical protein
MEASSDVNNETITQCRDNIMNFDSSDDENLCTLCHANDYDIEGSSFVKCDICGRQYHCQCFQYSACAYNSCDAVFESSATALATATEDSDTFSFQEFINCPQQRQCCSFAQAENSDGEQQSHSTSPSPSSSLSSINLSTTVSDLQSKEISWSPTEVTASSTVLPSPSPSPAPAPAPPCPVPSPAPAPQPSAGQCTANCGSSSCCGNSCYDSSIYQCFDGKLCPVGTQICNYDSTNFACYNPQIFNCVNNQLVPK